MVSPATAATRFTYGIVESGGGLEHDDVPALRRPEPVVDLAHEDPVGLQERRFHAPLAYLGDLHDEQVEDDRDDDRERERLDDLQRRPPGERRLGLVLRQRLAGIVLRAVAVFDRHRIKCLTLCRRWI